MPTIRAHVSHCHLVENRRARLSKTSRVGYTRRVPCRLLACVRVRECKNIICRPRFATVPTIVITYYVIICIVKSNAALHLNLYIYNIYYEWRIIITRAYKYINTCAKTYIARGNHAVNSFYRSYFDPPPQRFTSREFTGGGGGPRTCDY